MTFKQFKTRVKNAYPNDAVKVQRNELEYRAIIEPVTLQAGRYSDALIRTYFHGNFAGFLETPERNEEE